MQQVGSAAVHTHSMVHQQVPLQLPGPATDGTHSCSKRYRVKVVPAKIQRVLLQGLSPTQVLGHSSHSQGNTSTSTSTYPHTSILITGTLGVPGHHTCMVCQDQACTGRPRLGVCPLQHQRGTRPHQSLHEESLHLHPPRHHQQCINRPPTHHNHSSHQTRQNIPALPPTHLLSPKLAFLAVQAAP